jgi:hypothetical protein
MFVAAGNRQRRNAGRHDRAVQAMKGQDISRRPRASPSGA